MEQRYELIELLGTGGMATVHRARDTVLGREVALKRLLPHLAADSDASARFRREAQAVARLNHPGIVTVFDSGEDEDGPFIVMELIEGETLAHRLASSGPVNPHEAAAIVRDAAAALDEAHSQGVIHCDVKPSNMILDPSGVVRLTDFGIAKAVDDVTQVTKPGELVGTVSYLAPEIIAGKKPTPASDIYALGAVAYEMLVGYPPFTADNVPALLSKITNQTPPEIDGRVAPEMAAAISQALSKDPFARPETAGRLAMALGSGTTVILDDPTLPGEVAIESGAERATEPTVVLAGSTTQESSRRNVPMLALVAAVLLVLLLAVAAAFNTDVVSDPESSTTTVSSITTTTFVTTTTVPTSTTMPEASEQILSAIAVVVDGMNPPSFKPKDVRELEKRIDEVEDRAEQGDRDRLAESLEKALEEVLDLDQSQVRSELLDLMVLLIESYGFTVDEDVDDS